MYTTPQTVTVILAFHCYENFGSSQHAFLKIKGIPVFYFPFLAWPTTSSRKPGFLAPEFGQDTSNAEKFDLGYRIGIPFFWDFDPEHDLTLKYEGGMLLLVSHVTTAEGQ